MERRDIEQPQKKHKKRTLKFHSTNSFAALLILRTEILRSDVGKKSWCNGDVIFLRIEKKTLFNAASAAAAAHSTVLASLCCAVLPFACFACWKEQNTKTKKWQSSTNGNSNKDHAFLFACTAHVYCPSVSPSLARSRTQMTNKTASDLRETPSGVK